MTLLMVLGFKLFLLTQLRETQKVHALNFAKFFGMLFTC